MPLQGLRAGGRPNKKSVLYDQPDANGVVYTKDAIRSAAYYANEEAELCSIPLLAKPGDYESCIGEISSVSFYENEGLNKAIMVLDGQLSVAGTCEFVDVENNIVNSFRITSFGIGE